MGDLLSTLLFLLFVAAIVWLVVWLNKRNNKEIRLLRANYEAALKGGDKQAALQAGRLYYSRLRGNKLTIYDEQAISNDLATMK